VGFSPFGLIFRSAFERDVSWPNAEHEYGRRFGTLLNLGPGNPAFGSGRFSLNRTLPARNVIGARVLGFLLQDL
jgi:hypothetical protein